MSRDPLHTRAVWWLISTTMWWGFSFPLTKALYAGQRALVPEASSWFLASMGHSARCLLGIAILAPFVFRGAGIRPEEWRQGIWLGLAASGGLLLQADGMDYTLASTSAFLTQFCCVLVPLCVAIGARRAPSLRIVVCATLVLVGAAILSEFRPGSFQLGRGEAETLLATSFFTVQILVLERPRFVENRAIMTTFVMFAVVGIVLLAFAAASAPTPQALWTVWQRPGNIAILVSETLFCSLAAFILMNRWQRHVTSTEAGLIYCFEPVFASMCALFLPGWLSGWMGIDYPNEALTWRLLAGGGLILLANVGLQLRRQ